MRNEIISGVQMNPSLPDSGQPVRLVSYCRDNLDLKGDTQQRWAVLVLPGGGYQLHGASEAEPVALSFLNAGVQAFVLYYSVAPARWPQAWLETCSAIAWIRKNCARYGVRPDHIAVCGFSAGGHLAGCAANLWCMEDLLAPIGLEPSDARPDAAILSYPVISMTAARKGTTFPNLLGENWERTADAFLSLDTSVTQLNPPSFLWATYTDGSVPVENTLLYAGALRKASVPFELHLFHKGPHAMSLATPDAAMRRSQIDPHVAQWFPLCMEWLNGIGQEI